MLIYHVTSVCNLKAIRESGVRPEVATGKLKASWWVTRDRVVWAIAHVGFRHGVKVERLVVVEKRSDLLNLTQYQTGIFYCADVVPELPGRILQAASILMLDHKGRWLCTHEQRPQVQADPVAEASGIDWDAIAVTIHRVQFGDGHEERWRYIGRLTSFLPSGKWYSIADVGVRVLLEDVISDVEWLQQARAEAASRGWELLFDELGDTMTVRIPVGPASVKA